MKLKDALDTYYCYSGKASEITRYLGLAGIAIIWIFRVESTDSISLQRSLLVPTALLIAGLVFDLFQYVGGSVIWGAYHRHKEKLGTKKDEEFEAPRQINWFNNILFWLKIASIAGAHILILRYLYKLLFQ